MFVYITIFFGQRLHYDLIIDVRELAIFMLFLLAAVAAAAYLWRRRQQSRSRGFPISEALERGLR